MELFFDIISKDITINILIGFFYSAILGLLIFLLTSISTKRDNVRSMEIQLTKYIFASQTISISLYKIAKINGANYRSFFGDVLDGKKVEMSDYENVDDFIVFENVPTLPPLNDYLVEKFISKVENSTANKIVEMLDILKKTEKEKEEYITKNNLFLLAYEDFNRRVTILNERLDYYLFLTKQLISHEHPTNENKQQLERQIRVFKYCTDAIIKEANILIEMLHTLNDSLISNKREIKQEIVRVDDNFNLVLKILVTCLAVSVVLLVAILIYQMRLPVCIPVCRLPIYY